MHKRFCCYSWTACKFVKRQKPSGKTNNTQPNVHASATQVQSIQIRRERKKSGEKKDLLSRIIIVVCGEEFEMLFSFSVVVVVVVW